MLRAQAVAIGLAVEGHQDEAGPQRGLEAEDEVEQLEGCRIPVRERGDGVEDNPDDHQPQLGEDEDPAADEPGEVGAHALRDGLLALDLAVEVADGRVVVLVPDQLARDVFDLSANGHLIDSFAQKACDWLQKVSRGGFAHQR